MGLCPPLPLHFQSWELLFLSDHTKHTYESGTLNAHPLNIEF